MDDDTRLSLLSETSAFFGKLFYRFESPVIFTILSAACLGTSIVKERILFWVTGE